MRSNLLSLPAVVAVVVTIAIASDVEPLYFAHVAARRVEPRQVVSWTTPTAPQQTGTASGCSVWYNVVSGDTCSKVASSFGISVDQFVAWNPAVSADCSVNFWLGYAYCVRVGPPVATAPAGPTFTGTPCQCNKYYTVATGDDCTSVASKFGITTTQFLQWNPAVSSDCGTNFWLGSSYCVGVSGASTCPATSTTRATSASAGATGDPTPVGPTFTGIPCQCNKFYTVKSGDSCENVASKFSITTSQFLKWNPAVSSDCSANFWIGEAYCVGVTGASTCPATITVASSTSTSSIPPVTTAVPAPASPTFPGIPCRCNAFYKLLGGDTCDSVAARFRVSTSDFLAWNPEVSHDCTFNFYVGYSYCVGVGSSSAACSSTSSIAGVGTNTAAYSYVSDGTYASWIPLPTATDFPPKPVQDGVPTNCQQYYRANPMDTCLSIQHRYSHQLTEQNFFKWNPAVGSDCGGLLVNYNYCVMMPTDYTALPNATTQYSIEPGETGMPTTAWNTSELSALRTTFSGAATPCPVLFPAPLDASCDRLHSDLGIEVPDLKAWNTGINCVPPATLTPDYLYCIANPASTIQPIPTPPSSGTGPQPQQPGTVEDCSQFWFVAGTDDCAIIAEANGITEAQLTSYNPALRADCGGLEANYYVCVDGHGIAIPVPPSATSSVAPTIPPAITSSATTTATEHPKPTNPTVPGFSPIGCYTDAANRTLPDSSVARDDMTVQICAAYCSAASFTVFGVENSKECWCSNSVQNSGTVQDPGQCSAPCGGDQRELCGGNWSLNVYTAITASTTPTGSSTLTPTPTPTPSSPVRQVSGYEYKGCLTDGNNRTLAGLSTEDAGLTPERCAKFCADNAYPVFGVEYGKECYCGRIINPLAEASTGCDHVCDGDNSVRCGGTWNLDVYSKTSIGSIDGWTYQGCYTDSDDRTLKGISSTRNGLTLSECATLCSSNGAKVFGVEYGIQCYCGTPADLESGPAASGNCNMNCAGNQDQRCGGSWALDVFMASK